LYGVRSVAEPWSAGRWREAAIETIDSVHAAGRIPIVVGGTGLYLEALLVGLAAIPPVPAEIRAIATALHGRLGAAAFHAALATRDPETATRLDAGNTQRVIRAWELLDATGRGLAAWQAEPREPAPYRFHRLLLLPPRADLHAAADGRFRAMIRRGALEEAAAFEALKLSPDLSASRAVGLPPLLRHLAGELDLETAIAIGQRDTRHYIKRQVTWLRHRHPADQMLDEKFSETSAAKILPNISHFLLTP
jgi:tRNA dimethylallyltransferase